METINIVTGYKCNFSCNHCCTNSLPDNDLKLNNDDILRIKSALSNHKFSRLLFTGGEPTLYTELMNEIISIAPKKAKISITTNGWFTGNDIDKTLSNIDRLSSVLLSCDKFHSHLSEKQIRDLSVYCQDNDIEFALSVSLQSPLDFSMLPILKTFNGRVIYGKIESCGRARKNNVAYRYFEFDDSVLDEKCPNTGSITYYPKKGFSICCSNLVLNSNADFMHHDNIESHLNSDFYKKLSLKTFGELLSLHCNEIPDFYPYHSSACSMCELIHEKYNQ